MNKHFEDDDYVFSGSTPMHVINEQKQVIRGNPELRKQLQDQGYLHYRARMRGRPKHTMKFKRVVGVYYRQHKKVMTAEQLQDMMITLD